MIDTVVLRIHNIDQYHATKEKFYNTQKKDAVTTAFLDEETGEYIESSLAASVIYHDTNRAIPLRHRSNINLPSSHYSIAYDVNFAKNYLEFNFSVPKFEYETNLLQFISIYDQTTQRTFNKFMQFLDKFVKEYLPDKVLFEDIEINRIDLCYNQFFNNEAEALQYLDEQKKLLVKYARSSKNNFRSYDTSFMFITKRYSFKVYHKGSEFKKNDFPKLQKRNFKKYPLDEFIDKSNRILRYEMTFRNSYLNYLFKEMYFSSVNHSLNAVYFNSVYAEFYRFLTGWYEGTKAYNGTYVSGVESFNSRNKKFCLRSFFDYQSTDLQKADTDVVTFDFNMFNMLYSQFYRKVMQYQVSQIPDLGEVMEIVKRRNRDIETQNKLALRKKSQKDESRLFILAALCSKFKIEELKAYLPHRTYYRAKKDLADIGITSQTSKIDIPKPRTDYLDYRMEFGSYHYN